MRITIICDDNAVYKDGRAHIGLDLSSLPTNIHAFQWYDNYGEIEFKRQFVNGVIDHPPNEIVTEIPSWAYPALELWETAEALRVAKDEAAKTSPNTIELTKYAEVLLGDQSPE